MNNKPDVRLRPSKVEDLDYFFNFQLNKEAAYLAAFTSKDSNDRSTYLARHTKLLKEPTVNNQTILYGNNIAGSISKFEMEGEAEITYWIDRNFWHRGIATGALKNFLEIEITRPLFARVAYDNIGSQKVLEKCGFLQIGTDKGFANARQAEVEEFIYKLTY